MARMIPLGMGSGGGTVNAFVAQELPGYADERSIVIISDLEAGNISLRTTSPENPEAGDIWVEIGNTSPQMIALDGSVEMQLVEARRYTDEGWLGCDAYYAFCNEWVQFSVASNGIAIMGYEWNYGNPSPLLTRIEAASGLTASPSVGTVAGYSDFDSMPIFMDIRRCNLAANGIVNAYEGDPDFSYTGANGDVMVEIPKFWYKVEVDTTAKIRRFMIADGESEGFAVFPLFDRGDGIVREKAYIGAYEMGAGYSSKSGVAPLVSLTRAAFRAGVRGKGTGWSLQDLPVKIAIAELFRIEYATHNAQIAIGRGNVDATAALATGRTNSIAGHTGREAGTDGKTSVTWRGIENPWGNVGEWVDGFNINGGTFYHCLDASKFADDTATNYKALSFAVPSNLAASYATALGFDVNAQWAGIPSEFAGGSESTYLADACYSSTGWHVAYSSGAWNLAGACGVSIWRWIFTSSDVNTSTSSRLMYIPQQEGN